MLYKIEEWRRDSVLEMIGVDPADPSTRAAFHKGQGFDPANPPISIAKETCLGQAHFYNECPNIASDESYYAFWQEWALHQERAQQAQWDNHVRFANGNSTGAGTATLYTICNNRLETSSLDSLLRGSTGLIKEPPGSAEFIMEVGTPRDLATPSHHAVPPRIVARTRTRPSTTTQVAAHLKTLAHHALPPRVVAGTQKRPCTTTPVAARVAKKRNDFVTNEKGATISTDFYNERPKQKNRLS